MRLGGSRFSCTADSRLRVADDVVLKIDKTGLKQRGQRENDRGRVAAGISYQACASYGVAMKLGTAVDSLGLQRSGEFGVDILQTIDLAVARLLQSPCAAQVNHLDAAVHGFGDTLARLLMRSGEEENFDARVDDPVPSEGVDWV